MRCQVFLVILLFRPPKIDCKKHSMLNYRLFFKIWDHEKVFMLVMFFFEIFCGIACIEN